MDHRTPGRPGWPPLLFALILAVISGCGRQFEGPGAVVVATAWPPAERSRIEEVFRLWVETNRPGPNVSSRIAWVVLAGADDINRLADRRFPPDVLLGMERLNTSLPPSPGATPPFDDPRLSPVSLDWARSKLDAAHSWGDGYARLVGWAGGGPLKVRSFPTVEVLGAPLAWATLSRNAPNPMAGRAFLEALALPEGPWEAGGRPGPPLEAQLAEAGLLEDLLGATLVDARDELQAAWASLERQGKPSRSLKWMTEPPPWPPASVSKMLQRESNAMALVETLGGQIAPDADVRAWLLRSWLSPPRPVDGALLAEIAEAVDGRLAREPRFRAWLRSEWTAWARQRYRRVARSVEAPRS